MQHTFNVETHAGAGANLSDRPRQTRTDLQSSLARALPALWAKARDRNLTPTEQHKKLVALLVWAAGKQGFTAKQHAAIQYWRDQAKLDGRVDVLLLDSNAMPALYIELDWKLNEASLHKLHAGSLARVPVLWVTGVPYSTKLESKALRAYADAAMGKPTGWWLPIFHLEHGFI